MDKKTLYKNIISVAAGGALGALLRHGTNILFTSQLGESWIYLATAFENIAGSFFIGYLFTLFSNKSENNTTIRLFLFVGLIGSYTTYSGFSTQGIILIQDSMSLFMLYFFGQIFLGLIAVFSGMKAASA